MKKINLFLILLFWANCNQAQQSGGGEDSAKLMALSYATLDSLLEVAQNNRANNEITQYLEICRAKTQKEFGKVDSLYANYTTTLGDFWSEMGEYQKAEPLFLEAKTIRAQVFGEKSIPCANSLNDLGIIYKKMGQYQKSEYFYLQAAAIYFQKQGESIGFAIRTNDLGSLYQEMGKYEKAEKYYLQAIDIYTKTVGETHFEYATSLNNLAGLYMLMGYYEKAESIYLQAASIRAKIFGENHPNYAQTLNNLAYFYNGQGQYEKAEPLFVQTNQIVEKSLGEQHPIFAITVNNLAGLYYSMKNYSKAEPLFLKAQTIWRKTLGELHPNYAACLNNLAGLYEDIGAYQKAEPLYQQANRIYEKTLGSEHPMFSKSLYNLAGLYLDMNQLENALIYCKKSIDANSAAIDSTFSNWESLNEYTYYSNERMNASLTMLLNILQAQYQQTRDKSILDTKYLITQAAIQFNNRIRNDFVAEGDRLKSLETSNFFVLDGIKTGVQLAQKGYEHDVFAFAELNKGILLMDAVKNINAYKFGDLPDSLVAVEMELQKKHSDLRAALLGNVPSEVKDSLNRTLNSLNKEIEYFTKKIKQQFPKYSAIRYENVSVKAKDIQALLSSEEEKETALLEYVVDDSVIYIFYVDYNTVLLKQQNISSKILSERISRFHSALSNYKLLATKPEIAYQNYTTNAYWFYENLIAPVLEKANKNIINKLVIVPDGELGHLPFETFLTKPAPQKETQYNSLSYLLNNYSISYSYSATLWKENKQNKHHQNNGKLWAMAANYTSKLDTLKNNKQLPAYQLLRTVLEPLPAAQKEVETLSQIFKGTFAFDELANEKKFKEEAGMYAVIHLAMHGLLDHKNPILSSLAFTENGDSLENNFLQAYEISKMQLNADLVVLSACETGYGKFEKGNGIASLARAFMYAGASSLVVSLWQVNDFSTAEVMKRFYENLASGMPKNIALQQAKLDYIRTAQSLAAHPAFWSPFILMGNTDAIYLEQKGGWFWWGIGVGVVALLGGGYWLSQRKNDTNY